MKIKIMPRIAFIGLFLLLFSETFAQCPMCKMAAESNLNNGGTSGAGLNFGILYILALPYLMVVIMGYIWWRNRKKGVDDNEPVMQETAEFSEN